MKQVFMAMGKVYASMPLAMQGVIDHAASLGFTVEFELGKRSTYCRYLENGMDVFGIHAEYAALIEPMEFIGGES